MSGFKLYDWIPFFAAVRDKLLVVGGLPARERDEKINTWSRNLFGAQSAIVQESELPVHPFTFIYTLASKGRRKDAAKFYAGVSAEMELNSLALTDFVYPAPSRYSAVGRNLDCNRVWEIFDAVGNQKHATKLLPNDVFLEFLGMHVVGLANLTQSAFLINPNIYLPLDNTGFLGLDYPEKFASLAVAKKKIASGTFNFHDVMESIFACLPDVKPYEINLFGYVMLKKSDEASHTKFKNDPDYDSYCAEVERIAKLIGWQDNAAATAAPTTRTDATVAKTKAPLNRIFYGPPGTGKTYHTVNAAVEICDPDFYQSNKGNRDELLDRFDQLRSDKQVEFVTFHQSFDYEYFVEGLKAETTDDGGIRYEVGEGIFKRLCERAQRKEGVPHVLIIDEINRGNLSKIFGELITLLEKSKRIGNKEALRATLPYSNKSFGVPANLYLIGTMNTADRSIALLDTALRRRFEFVEMMPDSSLLRDVVIDDINVATMVDAINARIAAIYDRDHQIGHAYFMWSSAAPSVAELADVFRHKVLPLLQEYFYDDWEKIDVVLNHNGFVVADDMPPMPDNDWIDANKKLWRFDYTALYNRDKYRRIYESRADDSATDE